MHILKEARDKTFGQLSPVRENKIFISIDAVVNKVAKGYKSG